MVDNILANVVVVMTLTITITEEVVHVLELESVAEIAMNYDATYLCLLRVG